MRILFLIFFGFLIYRFLIKPLLLGFNDAKRNSSHSNPNRMEELLRRMQEFQQQQQYRQHAQQPAKKEHSKKTDDGEYIDYEEVD